ncbi:hypothetical protein ACFRFQ_17755 [Rhodococcus sp. NPDC056743]|uniref:hypothetical protein n=1 Tax=Rhodococcus sp. NPDC056743 TaxID=3345934 RepID=UPI00366CDA94
MTNDAIAGPYRVVEGTFKLPENALFSSDHLGTFHTTINGLAITLTLPSFEENTSASYGHYIVGPSRHYPNLEPQDDVDSFYWGFAGSQARNDDGTPNSSWTIMVTRFRFSTCVEDSDEASKQAAQTLYDALTQWWVCVSSWIELFTQQDLNPPVMSRPQGIGQNIPFWSSRDGKTPHFVGVADSGILRWPRSAHLLDAESFQKCLDLTAAGCEPPFEWMLIRDARSLIQAEHHRRAVIDAGTAAELALTRYIDDKMRTAAESEKRRHLLGKISTPSLKLDEVLLAQHQTLKGRSELFEKLGGKLPIQFLDGLVFLRNSCAHSGTQPTETNAWQAVEIATEVVETVLPRCSFKP